MPKGLENSTKTAFMENIIIIKAVYFIKIINSKMETSLIF